MMTEAFTSYHFSAPTDDYIPSLKTTTTKRTIPKCNSSLNMINGRCNNNNNNDNMKRGGSFVMGQKLRESKWFQHNEMNVFCAVVETGFIVQLKENDDHYGIVVWHQGFEKSKDPNYLDVYTLMENKGKSKVVRMPLLEFWPEEYSLRINNKSDKTEKPLLELQIRNQIQCAEYGRRKWHNKEHFTYFCRYGPVDPNARTRKFTNQLKWNTGTFFTKIKSLTIR